ncbi:unnamed protein product [Rotaria magnacalcarata]|uniref:Uncharacterized protein n=1 Tax=Rotaria magnacalcarata TaxID=392030 RepID=A0A816UAV8_9BILA|nr:unnamed protein product [Rotaria magnacalcarata]CAF2123859.1 unnamed protein product [Rotaria magnacalcarata]CAF2162567.1 unnamed protein product [Rotaria magnacalcarata]
MNTSNNSVNVNFNSSGDTIVSLCAPSSFQTVRFWTYLFFDISSLICTFLDLYYLLVDRKLRRALNNHVIIVLLIVGCIDELTNITWTLYNDHNGTPLIKSYTRRISWVRIRVFPENIRTEAGSN